MIKFIYSCVIYLISNFKKIIYCYELRLKFTFIFFKLIFEYSKNTKYEKDMANLLFTNLNKNFNVGAKLNAWKEDFSFFVEVINQYLNNTYITDENKYILEDFKNIIDRRNKSNYQIAERERILALKAAQQAALLNKTANITNSTLKNTTKRFREL